MTIALLCLSVLLLILFLKKRTSFPRLVIVLYAGYMITTVLHLFSEQALLREAIPTENLRSDNIKDVIRSTVYMLIWAPYFILSDRVAGTFIKRLKGTEPPAIPESPPELALEN